MSGWAEMAGARVTVVTWVPASEVLRLAGLEGSPVEPGDDVCVRYRAVALGDGRAVTLGVEALVVDLREVRWQRGW